MNTRTFNKMCKHLWGKRGKGWLPLTSDVLHDMLLFVVRHRAPVHKDLITDKLDKNWIACMGYLYSKSNFPYCLCEHVI